MINLHDDTSIDANRPIMIAHRGGVIAPDAPENSRRAIELAAQHGYHMVELDICCAADHVPVLFHGRSHSDGRSGGMMVDCGIDGTVGDFASTELTTMTYCGTDQAVLTLETGLDLCVQHDLGVMLDMKTVDEHPLPADYLERVASLFVERGFLHSMMTLSMRPEVRAALPESTLWPIRANNLQEKLASDDQLGGCFWFDDPASATDEEIAQLKARGALTIACINNFRYPPHSFNQLEAVDIERMKACDVDGYQIDSQYGHFFDVLQL